MLDQLTFEVMRPLVGTSFWADAPGGHRVELRVMEVLPVMESEVAKLKRLPFSIIFCGPNTHLLAQHTYPMRHEAFSEVLHIFIVPVGQQGEEYVYEAVFT